MILLAVPKSGTEYAAHLLGLIKFIGWEYDYSKYLYQLEDNVYGHIPWREDIEEALVDIEKVFLYRDPRDCIVSWFHWKGCSFEEALRVIKYRMYAMLPWESKADYVIRYEDLINNPEKTLEPFEIKGRIEFKAPTFRKGSTGDWVEYFSPSHVAEYLRDYASVRHWEHR